MADDENAVPSEPVAAPPEELEELGEPKPAEAPAEPEEDATQQLWDERIPDLAGMYGEISPEKRLEVLLNRLAAQPAGEAPKEDEARGRASNEGQEPRAPSVPEVPQLDMDGLLAKVKAALENGDGDGVAQALRQSFDYIQGMARLTHGAVTEQQEELKTFRKQLKDVVVPGKLRELVRGNTIRNATDADVARAARILESGEATTEKAALRLAVVERLEEIASAPKRKASDDARRKADGIRASRQGQTSQRGGGEAPPRIPASDDEWKAQLMRDAEQKK